MGRENCRCAPCTRAHRRVARVGKRLMRDFLKDLRFNHIGLALKRERDALAMAESLGYTIGERIYDPLQNVYVRLCSTQGGPSLEFVQPGNGKSPIDAI